MSSMIPRGIFAPVATIFDGTGAIDEDRFRSNLEHYADSALDGVVLLGSNGEFATLDERERLQVIRTGVETIGRRSVVMAGVGAESTSKTIELAAKAADLGVDYALVITPHYYKSRYDRDAYLRYYTAVADASPIPVIIYVMAAYTGVDLPTPIITELATHPNIVGIKDSGGHAVKVAEVIAGASSDFGVLAGSASFLFAGLCLGATGGILALGNVAPDACAELARLVRDGDLRRARDLQLRLMAPNAAVTTKYGIAGLKAALEMVGLAGGDPRPPLLPLREEERADVRSTLEAAGLLPAGH